MSSLMTSLKETPNVRGAGNAPVSSAGGRVRGGVTVPLSGFHSRASYVLVTEVSELPPPFQHPHRDQEGDLVLESDLCWNPSPPPAHCDPGALSLVLRFLLCKMGVKLAAPSWDSCEDQTQSLLRKFSHQPITNTCTRQRL